MGVFIYKWFILLVEILNMHYEIDNSTEEKFGQRIKQSVQISGR